MVMAPNSMPSMYMDPARGLSQSEDNNDGSGQIIGGTKAWLTDVRMTIYSAGGNKRLTEEIREELNVSMT
ncbi:hypothetical protein E2C01_013088 [Portunus trituberculatus]|uniref:Uncharacterized protein n=1 Tax=Portunus trituberculatus TaxID=210409 RepID=A0A5B7DG61_PORTR|nr:hypothetical protein [Portunus trituberculatus]